jgi:hypothetical protein
MMMKRALAVLLLLVSTVAAEAAQFKVIVNRSAKSDSLTKQQVSDLFLKKTTKWPDGTVVAAVDQPDSSAVREAFSKEIHGKPASAVKSYWNKQIFSGRDLPPLEKKTDAEVVAYVRRPAPSAMSLKVPRPTASASWSCAEREPSMVAGTKNMGGALLNRLKFRHKLLLLPALAAAGFLVVLLQSIVFNVQNARRLELIERGYYPATRDAEELNQQLMTIERAFQDAVAAQSASDVEAIDALLAKALRQIDSTASNRSSGRFSGRRPGGVRGLRDRPCDDAAYDRRRIRRACSPFFR